MLAVTESVLFYRKLFRTATIWHKRYWSVGETTRVRRYTWAMADDAVLDEIQENTKEAGLRLRASLSLLHSQGMIDDSDYRELSLCLRTCLAMVEAAYMEARRRG